MAKKISTPKVKPKTKTKAKKQPKLDYDSARAIHNITSFINSFTLDGDDDED